MSPVPTATSGVARAARLRTSVITRAVLLATGFVCLPAVAADDEFEQFKRAAEQGVSDIQQEFRSAVAEQDRQFTEHLRTQWAEFQAFPGRVRDIGPKPRALPVAPPPAAVPRAAAKPGTATRPKADLTVKVLPVPVPPPRSADIPAPRAVDAPTPRTAERTPVEPVPAPATPPGPGRSPGVSQDEAVPPSATAPVVPEERRTQAPVRPPVAPAVPAPVTPSAAAVTEGQSISLDFYGSPVKVPVEPAWRSLPPVPTTPDGLAGFWDRMSGTRFQPTLDAVDAARRRMALDDWGQALLWQEVAKALQPTTAREQLLLLWFFLVKSGFDARPGYSDNRLLLLVNVRQSVFGVSYVKVSGQPYYELFGAEEGKSAGRYSAYSGRYPAALRPLDIRVAATGFATGTSQRALAFEVRGKRLHVDVAYERPVTRYLDRFPQLDFELYFTTPPSPVAKRSLTEALGPLLKGLSQEDSVDLLLAFVQKAFEYKTDKDQFGREKYFFVEEVLHFPYSDCEDRSAMFSWLVRELLGIDTVGLHYPGHMTTAVALPSVRPDWQTIEWRGKRYVIADPTYINATVGMAMPSYRGQKPLRVVELR